MKPLVELLQFEQSAVDAELTVGAAFLVKKLPNDSTLESATKAAVVRFKDAFHNLYALYAVACANSFSALTIVLHPRHRSMTHQR